MDSFLLIVIALWSLALNVVLWVELRAARSGWRHSADQSEQLIDMLLEIAHEVEHQEELELRNDLIMKLRLVR
jgi:hypothetical protein